MDTTPTERVLILGGGFAGLNTAARLEKLLGRYTDVRITLVSRDNYSLFTPMLAEVAGGGIEPSHIVNPVRGFLKHTEPVNAVRRSAPSRTASATSPRTPTTARQVHTSKRGTRVGLLDFLGFVPGSPLSILFPAIARFPATAKAS